MIPGRLLNKRLRQFVQLVDLYPTILDTFGLEPPPGTHGKSVMPLVLGGDGERVGRDVACYGRFGESLNVTDGGSGRCLSGRSQNTLLYSHSQLPPQFGPYKLAGPFEKNGRFPVSCARGEMKTQLFKVRRPPTASDRTPDYPEIVATLKRQAADFLRSVEAPTGLCVSVS